ncbi:MAG: 2-polyprenyl-6-methoxyphenol hydroxylase-like oxidoreductase [Mycobacterium sp.]|jgi:2-polyprenyl-6-methoxyphenol hydroxylase-like FAD-dependent oxidoreductase|nr:2-polyprenyl-6-methoxyphenol hydroxylase-like oxidoreductase [Mycobacterium sp.]MDT5069074.1 5-methylphenazine-carboxylate 1-monooxygenase [Mycobacterium sp.]MDT5181317.1 5-methylphenazine-carboxylate 1-monooxygenase [Mycobacterium sp.]
MYWTYGSTEPTVEGMTTTQILIAGAGIGGLTAALALHQHGIEATVVDRVAELRPLGVGINLLPRAVAELERLGLADVVAHHAVAPRAIEFHDTVGHLLFREPRGVDGGYRWPQLSVHRGRLQALLLDTVRDRIGPHAVRVDHRVTGFEESADGVLVHTDAGSIAAEMLIGADGIHSAVRAQLHPVGDPLLWSGMRMFRGATRTAPFLDGETMAIIKGEGVDVITYPIGDGLVNWVVQVDETAPGALPGDVNWNAPADAEVVVGHLVDVRVDWLHLADLVRNAEAVLEYPMVDRNPLPWWSDPEGHCRVTLLGDAAHPMYPVGANGGSQSIIDALAVGDALNRDMRNGLRDYETRRRAETADVVAANREMLRGGARPDELADITSRYRHVTRADRS